MSGYIGPSPVPQAVMHDEVFTATSAQTTFATAGYTVGYIQVYQNGVLLTNTSDYTATNGSDVVLGTGATTSDIIRAISFVPFQAVDQTFTGTTTVDVLVVSGTVDGRDVATDGTKLDGIEALADVTDAANVSAAGGLLNIVEDTTPQLGGVLDPNGFSINEEHVSIGTGVTVDCAAGNVVESAPSASPTYVFSTPPTTGTAFGFTLEITPSATVTITWPASVDWAGGAAPASPASGVKDIYAFFTHDAGTTWFGFLVGAAMA